MISTWIPRRYWELRRLASVPTPSHRLQNKRRISPFPLHEFAMPDQRRGNLGPVQYWCSWQSCLFERLNSTFAWSNNLIVLTGSLLFKRFNFFCCQESEFSFSMLKLSQGKAFVRQTIPKVFLIAFHTPLKLEIMRQIHILDQKKLRRQKSEKTTWQIKIIILTT